MDAAGFVGHAPGPTHPAQGLGHGQAGLQSVLVESGPEVGAAVPDPALTLQRPELALGLDGRGAEQGMLVDLASQDSARRGRARVASVTSASPTG